MEFDKNDIMESQVSREKKKALKFLREAFEARKNQLEDAKPKRKHQLETLMSSMKVNRLKDTFYKKLTINNIFQSPTQLQLLSEKQKDKKRLIKLRGFHVPASYLAIVYVLEMIFMIITFYITSCMAFLNDFVQSGIHHTSVVLVLNAVTMMLCFSKIIITSVAQRINRGILLTYITDILIDYARSFILFVDLFYLFIMVMLFVIRQSAAHLIEEWSLLLFIFSIIRIAVSSSNLTLFRTTFINSLRKDQYYKLFQVILFNFIFAHFVASILFAMSKINSTQNWMIAKNIDHQVWYVQYMWGYYWATTTMMTVGFGDFLPVTYREGFIVAFLEFFSCIVLAYNISQIGGIISTIRSSQNEYIAKIAVFKRMAEQNEIDFQLKTKIQGYLRQQKAIKQKFEFNQQHDLLQSLPQPLKKEFIMASNGKLFKYLPFFKNLQRKTLLSLAEALTSKVFYPSETLQKANEYNDNIMILKEGKVGLAYRRNDSSLNGIIVEEIQIKKRQFVTFEGQSEIKNLPILLTVQFLSPGKVVNFDITAITYSYVFELAETDFLEVIKMSNIDTEYFFSITHQQSSGSEWEQLPCDRCLGDFKEDKSPIKRIESRLNGKTDESDHIYYHTKFQCPKLHYLPLKGVIIMKYLTTRGNIQVRKPKYNRSKQRSQSCLMLRKTAFITYEKKRFINEKRQFEKVIEKSISNKSKNLKKPNNRTAHFKNRSFRKSSQNIEGISIKDIGYGSDLYTLNKKQQSNTEDPVFDNYKFEEIASEEAVSEEEEDQHTIIESMIKYAVQEMNPRHANLHFWDLQIDEMSNYFNYFPQDNAAKLDNVQLSKDRASRIKGLCLISEILKLKNKKESNEKSKYSDKDRQKQSNAMTAFLSIFLNKTDMAENPFGLTGMSSNDVQYKKVYETKGDDVINEQKQKYLERYSKFTYQFPRQRMTDTSIREDERPSLNSVRKVRFSYDTMKQNAHGLSNSRNDSVDGNVRNEAVNIKSPANPIVDSFNDSRGEFRNYF